VFNNDGEKKLTEIKNLLTFVGKTSTWRPVAQFVCM